MTNKSVTVTIDEKAVTVPEGVTVLQACEQAGSPVPFYCYHPGLSIAGNCRICLVEIEKTSKLQIACYIRVAEGMVVHTNSDKALDGRFVVGDQDGLSHGVPPRAGWRPSRRLAITAPLKKAGRMGLST